MGCCCSYDMVAKDIEGRQIRINVIEPTSVSAGIEPASVSLFRGPEGTGTNHTQLYIPKQYGYSSGFKG